MSRNPNKKTHKQFKKGIKKEDLMSSLIFIE